MAYIVAVEHSEAQRRQLSEELKALTKSGRPLSARYEAQNFADWNELISTILQPGLFAQRETVIVEGAETLGALPENLAGVAEGEDADCALILVYGVLRASAGSDDGEGEAAKSAGASKLLAAVKDSVKFIKPEAQVPPWKRKDWLLSLAKSQGFRLNPEAAQLLAENIESQEELHGELSKLGLYAGKREITISDVEALSFDEGGRALMMFTDGVCDNKPHDVARALKHLRKDSVLPLLSAITNRLRIAMISACFPKHETEALRAIDSDPVKKKYALNKARNAIKHYGAERIKLFMMKAARLSLLEKSAGAEGWEGLELIIWELMAKV